MLNARLSHVALTLPDLEAGRRFYEDVVGLVSDPGSTDTVRLGLGQGDYLIELTGDEGGERFGLEIREPEQMAATLATLRSESVEIEEIDALGEGPAYSFVDPDGHRVVLHGRIDRCGEGGGDPGRRPVRLHHITLSTGKPLELAAFYERLGFIVSDRMGENFVWMRCNREHHTLAIVAGPAGRFDHYCYEIASWADLKTWCDELAVRRVPVTWGPGRHGPGNNIFIFVDDPAGYRIELSCEMERFWDDRVEYPAARNWELVPRTLNLWGTVPAMRESVTSAGAR
jgi:catechol 2,3-dioxygenase